MKREGQIGAAVFLAIAAVVGFSWQSGPKQEVSERPGHFSAAKQSQPAVKKAGKPESKPGCSILEEQLEEFLELKELVPPKQCYDPDDTFGNKSDDDLSQKTSQLKFVIALLPDPVHTHQSVLFDQFVGAIREGAQDEKYDFDSSWLPWDEDDSRYALFLDDKASNLEKEQKETQPGIILFRKSVDHSGNPGKVESDCKEQSGALTRPYCEGLVVFVVGEDATHGIHRKQFQNAVAWIMALRPKVDPKIQRLAIQGPTFSGSLPSVTQVPSEPKMRSKVDPKIKRLAILGPTFSGSLPSVMQVLSEAEITEELGLPKTREGRLAIYSGGVSSNDSADLFQNTFKSRVIFHSFVQNDDEILRRFCSYITYEQSGFYFGKVAIISEDETAYGRTGVELARSQNDGHDADHKNDCRNKALKIYYPRDISALRGAYQTKSLFDTGTSPQPTDTRRRNLPADLADPTGRVRDSIRSYGSNQTPLAQEAFLLEIVAALREFHSRYVLLRSSITLDQLFLTNFLRRSYPDGRIVIFGSDLMFIRERGEAGLSGAMALSTYPLFPLERDWTEHQSLPASNRVFSADTAEGTYIAFRLLLGAGSLNDGKPDRNRCYVLEKDKDKAADKDTDDNGIFVPPVSCMNDPPIPDYSPPFWTLADQCGEMKVPNTANIVNTGEKCPYPGPATWLSVIGVNRYWPMASLTKDTPAAPPVDGRAAERMDARNSQPGGRPEMPLEMKVFLLILMAFSLFHACCCWAGSYTAKPAFLAHFASTGDWRHTLLVFSASCCVAFLGIVTGWGCGVFYPPTAGLAYPRVALCGVALVCLMACGAMIGTGYASWRLSKNIPSSADLPRVTTKNFILRSCLAVAVLLVTVLVFYQFLVMPVDQELITENRVLTYWRAMHLASGVSPLVPIFFILAGLYLSFWYTLHGLALFGPDRPCLPPKERLMLKDVEGKDRDFLRMFSQEDAAAGIQQAAMPLNWKIVAISSSLCVLFFLAAWEIAGGVPVRSLGAQNYSIIFIVWLDICCSLSIAEAYRLYQIWVELKRLLAYLDRLPLRRTFGALRDISWSSVWKMSGNVLDVRYKVISRQMECMNHTITALQEFLNKSSDPGARNSLTALLCMHRAGMRFATWYSANYKKLRASDLSSFKEFQESIASTSGTLLTQLLLPAWRKEKESLLVTLPKEEKEEPAPAAPAPPPQSEKEHIRNAEEFVCLNYLGFIQNVLGRLRTMAMTIIVLFLASIVAMSAYPFDPRQAMSAILIALFVIVGGVIVKVYADMHRDSTLSHVTNTKPGELGSQFWFKIIGFGFAPLVGLLSRIFPSISDFLFSWLQPGISTLK